MYMYNVSLEREHWNIRHILDITIFIFVIVSVIILKLLINIYFFLQSVFGYKEKDGDLSPNNRNQNLLSHPMYE